MPGNEFQTTFRTHGCAHHLSWDLWIGWTLGMIVGLTGHTWRGFNPKRPGIRWYHTGYVRLRCFS